MRPSGLSGPRVPLRSTSNADARLLFGSRSDGLARRADPGAGSGLALASAAPGGFSGLAFATRAVVLVLLDSEVGFVQCFRNPCASSIQSAAVDGPVEIAQDQQRGPSLLDWPGERAVRGLAVAGASQLVRLGCDAGAGADMGAVARGWLRWLVRSGQIESRLLGAAWCRFAEVARPIVRRLVATRRVYDPHRRRRRMTSPIISAKAMAAAAGGRTC